MTRLTGVSDQIVFLDSGSSEVSLGWIESGDYKIDNATESKAGIGGGADYQYNLDGIAEVSGGFECNPLTLDILSLMGTKTGTTITFGDTLPSAGTFQLNAEASKYVELSDFKFTSVSIDFATGEPLKLSFTGFGLDYDKKSGTLNYTKPSGEPVDFPNMKVKIGGTYVGSVQTGNFKLDYQGKPTRGIENTSAGNIRKNTEILTGLKKLDLALTIEITDGVAWTQAVGGDAIPDSRSDTTVTIETGVSNAGTINITGVRWKDIAVDKNNDGEVRTAVITGNPLGVSISDLAA